MEFGALQCVPKSPNCEICPLMKNCFAAKNNLTAQLPVKSKKNKPKARYFHYFVINNNNYIFLEKRTGNDIWRNLYQFPLYESSEELTDSQIFSIEIPNIKKEGMNITSISSQIKHQLTHQTIYARFINIEFKTSQSILTNNYIRIHIKDILTFAVPVLLEPVLEKLSEIYFSKNI